MKLVLIGLDHAVDAGDVSDWFCQLKFDSATTDADALSAFINWSDTRAPVVRKRPPVWADHRVLRDPLQSDVFIGIVRVSHAAPDTPASQAGADATTSPAAST